MRKEFPAIFCQKREKNEPKKEKKREKKGAKAKIFFFFSRGNNLHTKFFARRARAFRDSTTLVREHTHTLLLRKSNSFERKGTRRDVVFFSRAFWSHLSLPTKRARVEISRVGTVFSLSFSREKKEARRTPKTRTVLAFPIRAKRQRKRTKRRDAKKTKTHRRLLRARRKERRAFFLSRFFSLLIARESWSVVGRKDFSLEKKESALSRRRGEGVRVTSQKKKKKKEAKTDCLGYQTDTKNFFSFFLLKKVETGPIN